MMTLYLATSIAFFIWSIRNILFWVGLWQLKEYRLDRLLAHFKETAKGKNILTSKILYIKWIIILGYALPVWNDQFTFFYQIVVFLIFTFEAGVVVKEVLTHRLKRPIVTAKALAITSLTVFIFILLYLTPLITEQFLWILFLDRFMPILLALIISFFAFPTEFLQSLKIERAMKMLAKRSDILVIGISGSYGKSSTKEYIAQVLSQKFSVLKTEGSRNTPMGIAYTILHGLKSNTEIFVAELGSYKKGEIAELCHIVHPKIGVTTSISDQHLSLFGSFQKIFETEQELIDMLPKDGMALFNGNNANAVKLYKQTKKKKILYEYVGNAVNKITAKRKSDAAIIAYNVIVKKRSITFTILINDQEILFTAPLLGLHTIENILPAIYIANKLKMNIRDIKKAVGSLQPLEKRMIPHVMVSGATILDDTFNASPESVSAALSYMKIYMGKRILILEPMIELGKNATQNHYALGKEIADICDYLFLTNKNFYNAISRGIHDGKGKCIVEVVNTEDIVQFIETNLKKEDIVVFEGREGAVALHKLI